MKVKKLISLLKKMPQDLEVGTAAHDNSEWEIAGWVERIDIFDKDEIDLPDYVGGWDKEIYDGLPKRIIVLHC